MHLRQAFLNTFLDLALMIYGLGLHIQRAVKLLITQWDASFCARYQHVLLSLYWFLEGWYTSAVVSWHGDFLLLLVVPLSWSPFFYITKSLYRTPANNFSIFVLHSAIDYLTWSQGTPCGPAHEHCLAYFFLPLSLVCSNHVSCRQCLVHMLLLDCMCSICASSTGYSHCSTEYSGPVRGQKQPCKKTAHEVFFLTFSLCSLASKFCVWWASYSPFCFYSFPHLSVVDTTCSICRHLFFGMWKARLNYVKLLFSEDIPNSRVSWLPTHLETFQRHQEFSKGLCRL